MDLAIRIELYMNFAIMLPKKSELLIRYLIQETVAEKEHLKSIKLSDKKGKRLNKKLVVLRKNCITDMNLRIFISNMIVYNIVKT
jgi:DNA-binding transcriptional regulator/RsmH inhibitor MraZ